MNNDILSIKAAALVLGCTIFAAIASAQTQHGQQEQQGGGRGGPPQKAFSACATASEGASCSFSGGRGEVTGTCSIPPQAPDSTLVCAPAGGPPQGGGRGQGQSQ